MEEKKTKIKIRYLVAALGVLVGISWYGNTTKKGPNPIGDLINNSLNSITSLFEPNERTNEPLLSPNDLKKKQLLNDSRNCKNQGELATYIQKLEFLAVGYKQNNKEEGSLKGLKDICDVLFQFYVKKQKLKGYYYEDLDIEYKKIIMTSYDNIQAMYKDFDKELITDGEVLWGIIRYVGADFAHIKK